ncbi:class I SAM-dependent methyltransferase [Sulfurimonas sp. SWIR-19]|uniref:class I SAM-dependent methyltransferase n=1 Tax=Sulfurimonas sp. SWIR-19 TaxID=2878390 RepID=UPI001CF133D1|nr:class I SAM-dependent methyltransferase [Sulfurimonas sp. SWIR-19]UCN01130.1 class I SAM-dependent methyltransferase [Sulfurimonas sp. SWIR-19]
MYEEKAEGYFRNVRKELLDLIPNQNRMGTMLEVGAGEGNTLFYAKENGYANKIYGVELCELKNSFQKSKEFEEFIIGDIEQTKLPFEKNFFDVILCGDVLEHLINPNNLVGKLNLLLKDNGVLIVSLPNIRQIQILKQIFLEGDFRYTEAGILDKTHLRFFCKKNMLELFQSNNMNVKKIISNSNLIGNTTKKINKLTFNLFDEFLAAQYYLVVGKQC